MTIRNAYFRNNTVTENGGGSLGLSELEIITVENIYLENSNAYKGDIWLLEVDGITFNNITSTNNKALHHGGAIFSELSKNIIMMNCLIE